VREPDVIISRSQVVNLGYNLRARLEAVARAEGLDVTSASRRVLTPGWEPASARVKTVLTQPAAMTSPHIFAITVTSASGGSFSALAAAERRDPRKPRPRALVGCAVELDAQRDRLVWKLPAEPAARKNRATNRI